VEPPTFIIDPPSVGTYTGPLSVLISTATSGASIRYTTDGSTPSETAGTLYTGLVNITTTTTLKAIAFKAGMTDSAVSTDNIVIGNNSGQLTGSSGDGFHALPLFAPQRGTFTATFDATPSASLENAVIGLSKGAAKSYTHNSCIARFNPSGYIDAYNGRGYAAASQIPYSADVTYHFRMVVNVTAHTYSVYVTPAGGSELTVGLDYAFRGKSKKVTSLDTWNLDENKRPKGCSLRVTNLTP
jgi:hypothetical protein